MFLIIYVLTYPNILYVRYMSWALLQATTHLFVCDILFHIDSINIRISIFVIKTWVYVSKIK